MTIGRTGSPLLRVPQINDLPSPQRSARKSGKTESATPCRPSSPTLSPLADKWRPAKSNVSRSLLTAVSLGVRASETVHPTGFEPVTLGSEDRCAIQLRHGCPSGREYGTRRRFATVHPVHSAVLKNNRVPSAVRGSVPIWSGARDVGRACEGTSPSRSNRSKDARFPPPAIPHTASSPPRSAGRSPAAPSTSDSRE